MAEKKKQQSELKRPNIPQRNKLIVWGAAAGRCTFCNRLVTENEDLGEAVPIGEIAHNVGWGEGSPRGDSELSDDERCQPENLVLLCRTCHKPVDDSGVVGAYGVNDLHRLKREHEARIRFLTEIGADRTAIVLRVVGAIRGVHPELTFETVLTAATTEGIFPSLMPGAYRNEVELDLRNIAEEGSQEYFATCARLIDRVAARVAEGVRLDDVPRLAVFGFARIPLLIHLGSRLDDKVSTHVFQRHRIDTGNAWRWPPTPPAAPAFDVDRLVHGTDASRVAVVLNLSGSIPLDDLPDEVCSTHTIYSLTPSDSRQVGPDLISSSEALASFETIFRSFLARIETDHGRVTKMPTFPAVPLSCAIVMGRTLMPNVSPALEVYDRDEDGKFFIALEVKR